MLIAKGSSLIDYKTEVACGNKLGRRFMFGMGERETMSTTATGEDIWRGNQLTPAPTSHTTIPTPADAGEQMTIVSESPSDASAGTGVQTLHLHYIDAAGIEQTETFTMNGATGVNSVATDIRFVQEIHSVTVGSGGVAAGHIKIYKTGSVGLVYSMIELGGNCSLVPHRMVPAGKKLILKTWAATEAKAKRVAFRIRSTDNGGDLLPGVFCFKGESYLNGVASPEMNLDVTVPALSIVKVSGWGDAVGGEGSCNWRGELVDV